MKNKKELIIVLVVIAVVAIPLFAFLGIGGIFLAPALQSARKAAQMADCINNFRQLSTMQMMYCAEFNDYVPPIAWEDGVNIWPALLWNETGRATMPYKDYRNNTGVWLSEVKKSHLFDCPSDKDTDSLSDSGSDMPKLSYAVNRSSVYNMGSSENAFRIPSGPVQKIIDIYTPSSLIGYCEAAWNKSASGSDAPGRLYSTMSHPTYGIKPGSVSCPWDQSSLGPEFNGKTGETTPWHKGKWTYSFMDGHVTILAPEQTLDTSFSSVSISDRVPADSWTGNHRPWGQKD